MYFIPHLLHSDLVNNPKFGTNMIKKIHIHTRSLLQIITAQQLCLFSSLGTI